MQQCELTRQRVVDVPLNFAHRHQTTFAYNTLFCESVPGNKTRRQTLNGCLPIVLFVFFGPLVTHHVFFQLSVRISLTTFGFRMIFQCSCFFLNGGSIFWCPHPPNVRRKSFLFDPLFAYSVCIQNAEKTLQMQSVRFSIDGKATEKLGQCSNKKKIDVS